MEEQMKFGFVRTLGTKISPKEVWLNSGFLRDVLGAKQYYSDYDNPDEPMIDSPLCCFCYIGNLQLNRVKTLVEGYYQTNTYEYGCIRCGAVFQGTVRWSIEE